MDLTCSETFRRKFPAQPMGPLRAITFSLDNGKEYPLLTSKEPTATYYKACSSSICDHNDKSKQKATNPTQKFDEDAY